MGPPGVRLEAPSASAGGPDGRDVTPRVRGLTPEPLQAGGGLFVSVPAYAPTAPPTGLRCADSVGGLRYAMTDLATRRHLRSLGLCSTDCAVFAVLAAHAQRTGVAWPSVRTLAEELGETERCVRDSLARLRNAGVVHLLSAPHTRSVYRLTLTPDRQPVATPAATDSTPERHHPQEEGTEAMQKSSSKGTPPTPDLLASPEVQRAQFTCHVTEFRTVMEVLTACYCATKPNVKNPAGLYRAMLARHEEPPAMWLASYAIADPIPPPLPPPSPAPKVRLTDEERSHWSWVRETVQELETCGPARLRYVVGLRKTEDGWELLARTTPMLPDWPAKGAEPILAACYALLGVTPRVTILPNAR